MRHFLNRFRSVLRYLAAAGFVATGASHFIYASSYQRIVPPGFPSPKILVMISGIFEIAGGIGLLVTSVRRMAGWGLIALLIAVFPANLYMAIKPQLFADLRLPYWTFIARLPLQAVLIVWVWFASDNVA